MNTKTTALAVFTIFTAAGVLRAAETNFTFEDDKAKASYAIGLNIGNNWKRQEVEVDFNSLLDGLKDATEGKARLTDAEIRATLNQFQQELFAKQQKKRQELSEKNKSEGEAFLAQNRNKPGVVTTPSGLQYKILVEGSGDSPKPEDTVKVNYRGTLVDGTEFESSPTGAPAPFPAGRMPVRGMTEALTQMKPGAKWQLAIPPQLAYGEAGRGSQVGPDATLIYEVELVSVEAAPPRAPLTSDIIKVPSLEEMKKGAKIETIKAEDLEKLQKQEQEKQSQKQAN